MKSSAGREVNKIRYKQIKYEKIIKKRKNFKKQASQALVNRIDTRWPTC